MAGVETVNGEDPTKGDVVSEIEEFIKKIQHSSIAVILSPCGHCGNPPHSAMTFLVNIVMASVANRNAEWSNDLAKIARRERARRAARS